MADDSRQKLFNALEGNNFKVGDFNEWNKAMDDPARREKFYNLVQGTKQFNLGDRSEFESKIAPIAPASPSNITETGTFDANGGVVRNPVVASGTFSGEDNSKQYNTSITDSQSNIKTNPIPTQADINIANYERAKQKPLRTIAEKTVGKGASEFPLVKEGISLADYIMGGVGGGMLNAGGELSGGVNSIAEGIKRKSADKAIAGGLKIAQSVPDMAFSVMGATPVGMPIMAAMGAAQGSPITSGAVENISNLPGNAMNMIHKPKSEAGKELVNVANKLWQLVLFKKGSDVIGKIDFTKNPKTIAKNIVAATVAPAREYLYKRGLQNLKESTQFLTQPTDASPTLKARDAELKTSSKYPLNAKGLEKVTADKGRILNLQRNQLKNAIAQKKTVEVTDIMDALAKDANNNEIGVNGDRVRNTANELRRSLEEAVNKHKDPVTGKYIIPIEDVHKIKSDLQERAASVYGKDFTSANEDLKLKARSISSDLIRRIDQQAPGYQKYGRQESKLINYQPILAKNVFSNESSGKQVLENTPGHSYGATAQAIKAAVTLHPEALLSNPLQHAVGRAMMGAGSEPNPNVNTGAPMLPPLQGVPSSAAQGPNRVPPQAPGGPLSGSTVVPPPTPTMPSPSAGLNTTSGPSPVDIRTFLPQRQLPDKTANFIAGPEGVKAAGTDELVRQVNPGNLVKMSPEEQAKIGIKEPSTSEVPAEPFVRPGPEKKLPYDDFMYDPQVKKTPSQMAEEIAAKEAQKQAPQRSSGGQSEFGDVNSSSHPALAIATGGEIQPRWVLRNGKVELSGEYQGIPKSLLDLSKKPTPDQFATSGRLEMGGNLDTYVEELRGGMAIPESMMSERAFLEQLHSDIKRYREKGGNLTVADEQGYVDQLLANPNDASAWDSILSRLSESQRRRIGLKAAERIQAEEEAMANRPIEQAQEQPRQNIAPLTPEELTKQSREESIARVQREKAKIEELKNQVKATRGIGTGLAPEIGKNIRKLINKKK